MPCFCPPYFHDHFQNYMEALKNKNVSMLCSCLYHKVNWTSMTFWALYIDPWKRVSLRGGLAGRLPSILKTRVHNWNSRLMFILNQLAFWKGMKFWLALGTVWLKASHGWEPQKVADLGSVGGPALQWQTSFSPMTLSALFKRIFHSPPVAMKGGWQMGCCNGLLCK